jgi:hypothetical protein
VNASRINSAAGVVLAAMKQRQTAAGIASALDAAGLLMSPETAAELERLRVRVAELESNAAPDAASRPLSPGDALCTCGHAGVEHHHAGTSCWAHLPRVGPIRVCGCQDFMPAGAGERS